MKTKEFIKKLNELGYNVKETEHSMIVRKEYTHLAVIYEEDVHKMKFFDTKNNELFNLCVEYARTPIAEREKEKKYYLRKKELEFYEGTDNYLNFQVEEKFFRLLDESETENYKTQFTQKEIDKIKEEHHTELSEFEQIEVE